MHLALRHEALQGLLEPGVDVRIQPLPCAVRHGLHFPEMLKAALEDVDALMRPQRLVVYRPGGWLFRSFAASDAKSSWPDPATTCQATSPPYFCSSLEPKKGG